jgi:hypothetical protein
MNSDPNSTPENPVEAVAPSRPAPQRFANALLIVDPGACNPSGTAYAIAEACQEARDEGVSTRDDPAVRLMVTQLAWVCRADSDTDEYGALLAACRARRFSRRIAAPRA